jgi:hypothetical protein|tara:strand:- start:251 stop:529 length:279 start_codon:yes stop_codon:yes gene_type:complete
MHKKNKKFELELIKKIVDEESTNAFIDFNVEFEFQNFDKEVQTVYVLENRQSPNTVEFHMLEDILERIREINPRYRVGIMFEERVPREEDFE